jgi:hypothetical protein
MQAPGTALLLGGGMVNWSKHLKHENPEFSPTFKTIVGQMAAHFDVEAGTIRVTARRVVHHVLDPSLLSQMSVIRDVLSIIYLSATTLWTCRA